MISNNVYAYYIGPLREPDHLCDVCTMHDFSVTISKNPVYK